MSDLKLTLLILLCPLLCRAEDPNVPNASGQTPLIKVEGIGAQIYECKSDKDGKLAWEFREPIATLILDGKTVGRHYAGPSWELTDGSALTGQLASKTAGRRKNDIPLLKLTAISHSGNGQLNSVRTIQRLDTKGGVLEGSCAIRGALNSVPYSALYVFLK